MRFIKYSWLYFLTSAVLIALSLTSIAIWKFKPSIDFAGGVIWEVGFKSEVENQKLENIVGEDLVSIQSTQDSILLRLKYEAFDKKQQLAEEFKELGEFEELRFESLGPSLGEELLYKTLIGVGIATLGILLYITVRFKDKGFGICAILAMLHDSIILLGSFSLLGHFLGVEVDSLFVTAFLTILAFSVHDTVVVFDRIRENLKVHSKLNITQIADLAITETLVRSINNSLTIIFVLLSLFLLGGASTKDFALALLIGTVLGTYSSTFTAVPLLVLWKKRFD
jgi:preprotein translocase subunit SecF